MIQPLLPLGFVRLNERNWEVNFNFYDDKGLFSVCCDKIVRHIQAVLSWGVRSELAFCLGSGKNLKVLEQLNTEHRFFDSIIALEQPRYIMRHKYLQQKK